jgi:hypothetical protein
MNATTTAIGAERLSEARGQVWHVLETVERVRAGLADLDDVENEVRRMLDVIDGTCGPAATTTTNAAPMF